MEKKVKRGGGIEKKRRFHVKRFTNPELLGAGNCSTGRI